MASARPWCAIGTSSSGSSPTTASCDVLAPSRSAALRSASSDGLPTIRIPQPVSDLIIAAMARDVPIAPPPSTAKNGVSEQLYSSAPSQIAWHAASSAGMVNSGYQPASTASACAPGTGGTISIPACSSGSVSARCPSAITRLTPRRPNTLIALLAGVIIAPSGSPNPISRSSPAYCSGVRVVPLVNTTNGTPRPATQLIISTAPGSTRTPSAARPRTPSPAPPPSTSAPPIPNPTPRTPPSPSRTRSSPTRRASPKPLPHPVVNHRPRPFPQPRAALLQPLVQFHPREPSRPLAPLRPLAARAGIPASPPPGARPAAAARAPAAAEAPAGPPGGNAAPRAARRASRPPPRPACRTAAVVPRPKPRAAAAGAVPPPTAAAGRPAVRGSRGGPGPVKPPRPPRRRRLPEAAEHVPDHLIRHHLIPRAAPRTRPPSPQSPGPG